MAGNDTLDGGSGADTLIGGLGDDTYVIDSNSDVIVEDVGGGIDTVSAGLSYLLLANFEKLLLTGTGNFNGTGNELANTLTGNGGNNSLAGGSGNDIISAGAGDDVLTGGLGADALTGGTGADTFVFDTLEALPVKDTIGDFVHAIDHIAISRATFTAFSANQPGALSGTAIAFGAAATNSSQHLVYNVATGGLFYDVDGAGGAAQVQIALLSTRPALDASDFVLV